MLTSSCLQCKHQNLPCKGSGGECDRCKRLFLECSYLSNQTSSDNKESINYYLNATTMGSTLNVQPTSTYGYNNNNNKRGLEASFNLTKESNLNLSSSPPNKASKLDSLIKPRGILNNSPPFSNLLIGGYNNNNNNNNNSYKLLRSNPHSCLILSNTRPFPSFRSYSPGVLESAHQADHPTNLIYSLGPNPLYPYPKPFVIPDEIDLLRKDKDNKNNNDKSRTSATATAMNTNGSKITATTINNKFNKLVIKDNPLEKQIKAINKGPQFLNQNGQLKPMPLLSDLSCDQCYHGKLACDRELPACTRCILKMKQCDYTRVKQYGNGNSRRGSKSNNNSNLNMEAKKVDNLNDKVLD